LVPKHHELEMVYGESDGRVIDDVTWSWKVNVMTPICYLEKQLEILLSNNH